MDTTYKCVVGTLVVAAVVLAGMLSARAEDPPVPSVFVTGTDAMPIQDDALAAVRGRQLEDEGVVPIPGVDKVVEGVIPDVSDGAIRMFGVTVLGEGPGPAVTSFGSNMVGLTTRSGEFF